jgi:hypothetical protein
MGRLKQGLSRIRQDYEIWCTKGFWGSKSDLFLGNRENTHRRRGSESNEVFTDNQPQYPDLRGNINAVIKGVQEVSTTIRELPDLTRQSPVAYSVIEEIVEGFVEGF